MYLIKVKANAIIFSTQEAEKKFNRLLLSYSNTGKTLSITIEEHSKKSTTGQFDLFKAMIIAGQDKTGMSYSEFENELINNFAPYNYITDITGKKVKERLAVHDMTRKQFSLFVEECVRFMNEFFEMDFKLG